MIGRLSADVTVNHLANSGKRQTLPSVDSRSPDMTVATFDTYAAAKALREAGFNEGQAEAAVTMVSDAVTEDVATRADMARIEDQLAALEWIVALHTALTIVIAARLFGSVWPESIAAAKPVNHMQ